jgi:hypothetical protein
MYLTVVPPLGLPQIYYTYHAALEQVKARQYPEGQADDAPDLAERVTLAEDQSHRREKAHAEVLQAARGVVEEARSRGLAANHHTLLRAWRVVAKACKALENHVGAAEALTEVRPPVTDLIPHIYTAR